MRLSMPAPQPHAAILFLAAMALTCTSMASEPAHSPGGRICPDSNVRVYAADARDVRDGCSGARAALAFLKPLASKQIKNLDIQVREKLPAAVGTTAVGAYIKQCSCSMFVPYTSFKEQKTWFNVPVSRDLYRSLATHEAAHAVAAQIFEVPSPTILANEYVAYVTMFATMDPVLRGSILRALPGTGFAGEDHISVAFYMFDPMRFGAESYRHYLKPENGDAFLQLVLAGKVLTTD